MAYANPLDNILLYASGVVDADPKLKESIIKNPKAAYTIVGRLKKDREAAGLTSLSVAEIDNIVFYICGWCDVPWDKMKEIL